jgi:hypothetical protein
LRRFDSRYTIAERLQTGGLAIRDSIINFYERNLGEQCDLRKTTGQVEPNDRPAAAKMTPLGATKWTLSARQLGPRRHAVSHTEPADALADFQDPRAELVPEKLHWSLGLKATLDSVERQRRYSFRKLRLGNAGLDAEWFDQHMARLAGGRRDIV